MLNKNQFTSQVMRGLGPEWSHKNIVGNIFDAFRNFPEQERMSLNEFLLALICCSKGTVGEKALGLFHLYSTAHEVSEMKHSTPTTHFTTAIVEKGLTTVSAMTASINSLFTFESLSAAGTAFGTGDVSTPNEGLVKALTTSLDSLDLVIAQLMTMERFVMLTIPKMEDGNNFGVTVQLAALKHMKDERELLSKALEELSKYYSCRADAIEKCKLPTTNSTKTSVQCNSSGESKGGEKEGKTTSTETKVEEKNDSSCKRSCGIGFPQASYCGR